MLRSSKALSHGPCRNEYEIRHPRRAIKRSFILYDELICWWQFTNRALWQSRLFWSQARCPSNLPKIILGFMCLHSWMFVSSDWEFGLGEGLFGIECSTSIISLSVACLASLMGSSFGYVDCWLDVWTRRLALSLASLHMYSRTAGSDSR